VRIAVAEVGQETCSFTSVRTTVDTFRQYGLYEGEEILERRSSGAGAVSGFLTAARDAQIDLTPVPIISGWAGANGPLTDETLRFFIDKLVEGLERTKPFDGFFFSLHGAAAAESEPDVEGALLAAARDVLGSATPLIAAFDHHGNITQRIMSNLDGLVAHRTQPHNPYDTGYHAGRLLFDVVQGHVTPVMAWHKIPMISHQEQFLTSRGPMKRWFDRARSMESMPGVASVSTFPIQPWLDVPEGGWTTVVITDDDAELAHRLSAELAQMAWDTRAEFWVYESIPVDEAVRRASAAERGLVILSDTGDSVFGGATGDSTAILQELLAQNVQRTALVPMVDPEAAYTAFNAGIGAQISLELGGKLDTLFGQPLSVTATVAGLAEGMVEADVIGRSAFDMGKSALLEIGAVKVVVSENVGIGGNHPIVYRRFGIEPAQAHMAVLKTASNFQYYADMTSEIIRADTLGPTMSHLEKFKWQHTPRPIYPLDELNEWRPT
jgi:microcystin degradation protein MlrC